MTIRTAFWFALILALTPSLTWGATIEDVLKKVDAKSGKPFDTQTSFTIQGVVAARATGPDGSVLAIILTPGSVGVPIWIGASESAGLTPRTEVEVTGQWAQGPYGAAVLKIAAGGVHPGATNKSVGAFELRGAGFFKDASSLAGRYVSLTNVSFASAAFDGSGKAVVKGDDGEVPLLVTIGLKGKAAPTGSFNVFGVPVQVNGEWRLLAARFISVNNKAAQALATKRTCFTCHNPDIKNIGPAYRDVAAKYREDPDAIQKMCGQIEKGGGGRWGPVPMPALGALVPPDERRQLAEWIFGYRWDALLAE